MVDEAYPPVLTTDDDLLVIMLDPRTLGLAFLQKAQQQKAKLLFQERYVRFATVYEEYQHNAKIAAAEARKAERTRAEAQQPKKRGKTDVGLGGSSTLLSRGSAFSDDSVSGDDCPNEEDADQRKEFVPRSESVIVKEAKDCHKNFRKFARALSDQKWEIFRKKSGSEGNVSDELRDEEQERRPLVRWKEVSQVGNIVDRICS